MNNRSNLDSNESGNFMFYDGGLSLIYSPYTGLAAAKTEHLALREQCIPAFAIVTVYCSIASCIATLSPSSILSNSSIQTNPLSAKTIAPASNDF